MAKKAGRPRVYKTAAALRRAVDAYFDSISYKDEVQGLEVLRYVTTPSMAGLCLYLGISRSTWSSYGSLENGMEDVVEYARLRVEAYLAGQLDTKFSNGAKFNLMANFGWREKVDVTGDGLVKISMGEESAGE